MDRIESFHTAVRRAACRVEDVNPTSAARALSALDASTSSTTSLGVHTGPFERIARSVGDMIRDGWAAACARQRDYLEDGRVSEADRDAIEADVTLFLQAASARLSTLQTAVETTHPYDDEDDNDDNPNNYSPGGSASTTTTTANQNEPPPREAPTTVTTGNATTSNTQPDRPNPGKRHRRRRRPPVLTADQLAHRRGVVLILSERLSTHTSAFGTWRATRARQTDAAERRRRARRGETIKTSTSSSRAVEQLRSDSDGGKGGRTNEGGGTITVESVADRVAATSRWAAGTGASQEQAQLAGAEAEVIWARVAEKSGQIREVERTVHEISDLGQALSGEVARQAQQIEQLYYDAVDASRHLQMGNKQLTKALAATKASTWYMVILIVVCAKLLLFADWLHS